jgi:hypothetical protein
MSMRNQAIHIEVDGAMSHPACQPGEALIALPIIGYRPYQQAEALARTQAAITYARAMGLTGKDSSRFIVRLDGAHSWGMVGHREAGVLVGLDAQEAAQAYCTGCLPYRRSVNATLPNNQGAWVGAGFDVLCNVADAFRAADIQPTIYLDDLGESVIGPWSRQVPEIAAAMGVIASSPRARARGFPATIPTTLPELADGSDGGWFVPARKVADESGVRMCRDAGFTGTVIVAFSCAVDLPIRFDGRPQVACLPVEGRASNAWWYGPGPKLTAACVEARRIHESHHEPYYAHFSAKLDPDELEARLRMGGPGQGRGASVVWGDPADLGKLNDLTARARLWT